MIIKIGMKPIFLNLLMCFLFGFNNLSAQTKVNKKLTILEYGFPPLDDYLNVRRSVDSLWNIRHEIIAGCLVTTQFEDSVRFLNEKTYKLIAKKHGNDWKKRYEAELKDSIESDKKRKENQFTTSISVKNEWISENSKYNENESRYIVNYHMNENQQQIKSDEDLVEIATIKNLEHSTPDLIYRGYDNLFEIKVNDLNAEYHFNCTNCSVLKTILNDTLAPFVFAIRTQGGIENPAELTINNDIGDTSVFQFQKANLPVPIIYLNQFTEKDNLDLSRINSTITITVQLPKEISLKTKKSEVLTWEIQVSDIEINIYKGTGSLIPKDLVEKIKQLNSGSEISIFCAVKGSDKIVRKKTALFKIL